MVRLFLVRHGQRGDFVDKEWMDKQDLVDKTRHTDSVLSELGLQQAQNLAQYFAHLKLQNASIFSSPYTRCLQTALPLCDVFPEKKICMDHGIMEWDGYYEQWSTLRLPQSIVAMHDSFKPHISMQYSPSTSLENFVSRFPFHETREMLNKRVQGTVRAIVEQYGGDSDLILVSHGACVIAAVEAFLSPEQLEHYKPRCGVASVAELQSNDKGKTWELVQNGTTHFLQSGELYVAQK